MKFTPLSLPNVLWPARLYPKCCLLGFSCDVSRLLYPNLYHKTVYAHDSTWLEASIGHFSFSRMLIRGEFPWSIFEKLLKLMEKWVFVTSVNFFFQRSNTQWRSEINSAKKIVLTLMRTHFYGHRTIKHLFALILINGSRRRQRSRSIFLQFTTFLFVG